jgi:hypothetical protein
MYIYQGTDLIAKAESYLMQAESAIQGIEGPHDPQMATKLDLAETLATLANAFLELNEAFEELDDETEETDSTGY